MIKWTTFIENSRYNVLCNSTVVVCWIFITVANINEEDKFFTVSKARSRQNNVVDPKLEAVVGFTLQLEKKKDAHANNKQQFFVLTVTARTTTREKITCQRIFMDILKYRGF
uniref:Uncharacterized protein n=1 Tax=Romanomermis culicivorax TaxID=13658 RepID=A0A915J4N6_ROMCU